MLSSGLAGKMKWDGIKSLIAPGTGGHSVHTAVIILIIVCHPLYFWFPLSFFFFVTSTFFIGEKVNDSIIKNFYCEDTGTFQLAMTAPPPPETHTFWAAKPMQCGLSTPSLPAPWKPAPPLTSCLTLSPFPIYYILHKCLGSLFGIFHVRGQAECLAHGKCSIHVAT